MALVEGLAYWASVTTPNTKFEPVYSVNLLVDDDIAKEFAKKGHKIKQMDEGPSIVIKRKATDKKGNAWSYYHGDAGRSRMIELDYTFNPPSNKILTRSYSYPNPIREQMGTLRVETVSAKIINVLIYDLAGYFIRSFNAVQNEEGNQVTEWVWDVGDLESGVYFAHVEVSNNKNVETSIIKVAVIH